MGEEDDMEQSPQPIPAALTDVTPPRRSKPGPKPGTEAAKRGGQAAKQKYGSAFYAVIGAKGGTTVRDRKGVAFYETIGRQGGLTTRRRYGLEHYARTADTTQNKQLACRSPITPRPRQRTSVRTVC